MATKVAVVGVGQTRFEHRKEETSAEIVYEAASKALKDAGMTRDDIEAVIFGTAPDAFDGIHMQGENVLEAAGGFEKPYLRNTTGGATGVVTAIVAYLHIASGLFDSVLVVCEEKMSPPVPHAQEIFVSNWDELYLRPLVPNVVRTVGMEPNRYIHFTGLTEENLAMVSVKNKRYAMDNPYSQTPALITVEDVLKSPPLCLPLRLLHMSATSDGAAAAVMVSEEKAKGCKKEPLWVAGVGYIMNSQYRNNEGDCRLEFERHVELSGKMAYKMASITNPREEIDVAEIYNPYAIKEIQHSEALGFAPFGEGWKLLAEGASERGGDIPINPSGGLLGVGNPIAASGMQKFIEVARQLWGEAGRRQVPGNLKVGLAQAWGGLSQFSGVIILGKESE